METTFLHSFVFVNLKLISAPRKNFNYKITYINSNINKGLTLLIVSFSIDLEYSFQRKKLLARNSPTFADRL